MRPYRIQLCERRRSRIVIAETTCPTRDEIKTGLIQGTGVYSGTGIGQKEPCTHARTPALFKDKRRYDSMN